MDIQGYCDSKYNLVQDQFKQHLSQGKEKGAAVAIWHEGKLVVNLWAGVRDKQESLPWQENTIVNVFSTSKMISAICVQKAREMGAIDLERPVKDYWPEYGCQGKSDTSVAWLLNHKAGLPAMHDPVADEALFDWDYMCQRLARESPWWRPGTQHGYHMVTWGWLVGETFRRAVGITLGEFLRQEIAEPYHLNIHLGLNEAHHEIADLFGAQTTPEKGRLHLFEEVLANPKGVTAKALTNPPSLMTSSNKPQWRAMELPSANVHCNAASLATLMGLCVNDDKLLSESSLGRLLTEESAGPDPVLTTKARFGPGVMLQLANDPEASFGNVHQAFGHPGSGGAMAFADPENRVGFAYVMNQMGPYLMVDPRPRALADAFYSCLG